MNKREKDKEKAAAKIEFEISQDERHQEALDAYLSRMSNVLLDYKAPLQLGDTAVEKAKFLNTVESIMNVIRAQTVAVLRVLDGKRKGQVLEFLYHAGFIKIYEDYLGTRAMPLLDLTNAELRHVDLIVGRPRNVDDKAEDWGNPPIPLLKHYVDKYYEQRNWSRNLEWVSLKDADLYSAALVMTNLTNADLTNAYLVNAFLLGGDLTKAKLINADLRNATLYRAKCIGTDFTEAIMSGASFEAAYLHHALFFETDLEKVNFTNARYNKYTQWPDTFDPKAAGAIEEDKIFP